MRTDIIATAILRRSTEGALPSALEKALLMEYGSLPDPLEAPIPDRKFDVFEGLLRKYSDRVNLRAKSFLDFIPLINYCLKTFPVLLLIFFISLHFVSWLVWNDALLRWGSLALSFFSMWLVRWLTTQNEYIAYWLVDNSSADMLLRAMFEKDKVVSGTTELKSEETFGTSEYRETEVSVKLIICKRLLYPSRRQIREPSEAILIAYCCLYVLGRDFTSFSRSHIAEKLKQAVSFLSILGRDEYISYLWFQYYLAIDDLAGQSEEIRKLEGLSDFTEIVLYTKAVEYVLSSRPKGIVP